MKIGIIGGYGYKNWGDDAQLMHSVIKLKEKGYNDIVVFSRAKYIQKLVNVPICPSSHNLFKDCKTDDQLLQKYNRLINNTDLNSVEKQFIKNIKSLDVLFFSGSGTINTRHLRGLCIFLTPCMLAKIFNKKVILSGQGIGPLTKPQYYSFITNILNDVDKIYVRDFESGINQLEALNVNAEIGVDDAFDYPITTDKYDYLKDKKVVGINISSFITEELKEVLFNLAVEIEHLDYHAVFNYFQNEGELAEEITKGKFEITSFANPSEIAEFYSHCKCAVGMRYHSTIFSISQKVPHVNLYLNNYQKLKINAIEEETGLNIGIDCQQETLTVNNIIEVLNFNRTYKNMFVDVYNDWKNKKYLGYDL